MLAGLGAPPSPCHATRTLAPTERGVRLATAAPRQPPPRQKRRARPIAAAARAAAAAAAAAGAAAVRRKDGWPGPSSAQRHLAESAQSVPRVDGAALAEDWDRSEPLCLQGLTADWSITRQQMEASKAIFRLRRSSTLHEHGYAGPMEREVTLAEYFQDALQGTDAVIFENDFLGQAPVGQGFLVPKVLQDIHGKPLFSAGRQDTGVGLHRHNESWLAQIEGRKAWILVPPDSPRPTEKAPWQYFSERPGRSQVCVVLPGEILFVPRGWWHGTWNLDDSFAVGWEAAEFPSEAVAAVLKNDSDALQRLEGEERLWALELCARSGNLEMLKQLHAFGSRVPPARATGRMEPVGPEQAPAVAIAAARSGQVPILDFLASSGLEEMMLLHRHWWLPASGCRGTTALHEAASCGHVAAVRWLLQHGEAETVAEEDDAGCVALHLAATHGQHLALKALLHARCHPDTVHEASGTTALHQAAFGGHAPAAAVLLSARAAVNAGDALQQTPLHYAALRGHCDVLRVLLEHKAQVNCADLRRKTPLHHCAEGFQLQREVLVPLVSASPASLDRNLPALQLLLAARAELRQVDQDGRTACELALAAGHTDVVALLTPA
ncbi:unnamed protein product, partial [Effrenium voratum]